MRVSENTLRKAVRKILLERLYDEPPKPRVSVEPSKYVQTPPYRSPEIGNKFSYVTNGDPDGVMIAKAGNSNLAIPYSRSKNQDPVASGNGRLINSDELGSDWDVIQGIEKEKLDPEKIQSIIDDSSLTDYQKSKKIYDEMRIFVPINPQRPKYESTSGAIAASQEGKCTMSLDDVGEIISKTLSSEQNLGDQEREQLILRIATCLESATIKSNFYMLAQLIVSFLPGLGIGIAEAMNVIPGIILFVAYLYAGERQHAIECLVFSILLMCVPRAAGKLGLSSWKKFIFEVVGLSVLLEISNSITTKLVGKDYTITESELKAWIGDQPDAISQDRLKKIADPQGLLASYPRI